MPIDTSIYGQIQPPAPLNPFGIAFQMQDAAIRRDSAQALQEQRQALAEQRQQALADRGRLDSATAAGGSTDDIIARLPGHLQATAREAFGKADDAAAKAREARSKADAADADYFGQLASSVKGFGYDPAAAQIALDHAKAAGHDVAPIMAQVQKFGLQKVIDNLIAAAPGQRELGVKETTAATGAAAQVETGRHNVATEGQAVTSAAEVARHNKQLEADAASRARLAFAQFRETARHNGVTEAQGDPDSPKNQQKLEQQYRGVLTKEISSRSGGLGTEDQKVNQAIHLRALMDQALDPKTGQYNIPRAQYAELASGLATLVSPNGRPTDSMRGEIEQATATGDFNKLLTYVTGKPANGSTQDMYKMLRDSIDRQGRTAEQNRETYLKALRSMAPTDLAQERRDQLEKSLQLNSLDGPATSTAAPVAAPGGGTQIGRFSVVVHP